MERRPNFVSQARKDKVEYTLVTVSLRLPLSTAKLTVYVASPIL